MKPPTRIIKLFSVGVGLPIFLFVSSFPVIASPQFTKETGKKCADCHSKIPKKGDKELYLTELGKKFKENGNKLPSEKK